MITYTVEITSITDFKAWSGAVAVIENLQNLELIDEADDFIINILGAEFDTETALNDFIWFDLEDALKEYGIMEDEDDD